MNHFITLNLHVCESLQLKAFRIKRHRFYPFAIANKTAENRSEKVKGCYNLSVGKIFVCDSDVDINPYQLKGYGLRHI